MGFLSILEISRNIYVGFFLIEKNFVGIHRFFNKLPDELWADMG